MKKNLFQFITEKNDIIYNSTAAATQTAKMGGGAGGFGAGGR